MGSVPYAIAFLLMIFAGSVNRHQLIVIEFLQTENRLLKERLRGRRIAARRFRAVRGDQKYLAVYHLQVPAVVESKAWSEAVETPWTLKMRPRTSDRLRVVCAAYKRAQPA